MKPFFYFVIGTLALISCKNTVSECDLIEDKTQDLVDTSKQIVTDTTRIEYPLQSHDTLYTQNKSKWKQGHQITKNEWGKTIEDATYRNDTIIGYYRFYDGMQQDGYYENGKKHGNFNTYYPNGSILLITHYEHDSIIWYAPYIANQQEVVPIKPLTIKTDKEYVRVPHPNGKTWYEGLFMNKAPVGIHHVYYDFGQLKGIINYDSLYYTSYDSSGNKVATKKVLNY